MNPANIFFIGRKQGIGLRRFRLSHLENRRPAESDGLRSASSSIRQVRLLRNADVIWVRVRPEFTTDKERQKIGKRLRPFRDRIPIINDIAVFNNYDCKDITFSIWKEHGIACPDFISFDIFQDTYNNSYVVEQIQNFLQKYGKVLLRTNNETAANGVYLLNNNITEKEINAIVKTLENRCKMFFPTRSSTRIIAVEFISSQDEDGYIDLYRAHILMGQIISYYAVTSKQDIFHNVDMKEQWLKRFINLNEILCDNIHSLKSQILRAASALECNLGAIEFFLVDNKPIFIEFNPMWGGHASTFGFGNTKVQNYLDTNIKELKKRIPNIYAWLNYPNYYKALFEQIHKSIQSTTY
tara:strand:- start:19777 stop:20838 length:1062 start_codon:yes stop_codon:yes gene_type:complete